MSEKCLSKVCDEVNHDLVMTRVRHSLPLFCEVLRGTITGWTLGEKMMAARRSRRDLNAQSVITTASGSLLKTQRRPHQKIDSYFIEYTLNPRKPKYFSSSLYVSVKYLCNPDIKLHSFIFLSLKTTSVKINKHERRGSYIKRQLQNDRFCEYTKE